MSSQYRTNLIEKQKVYACAEAGYASSDEQTTLSSSARELFTQETGNVLVTLGNMFVNVPPFNGHIDRNTGNMLISIGRKLKAKK